MVVACWAGLCLPAMLFQVMGMYGDPVTAGGIQGPRERSALLLPQEEIVLVLRTSQELSVAVGLIS